MSLTTKPPAGDVGRPTAAPATPPGRAAIEPAIRPSASEPAPQGSGTTVPSPAARAPLDLAGALRILLAEIRAAVIEELETAARLPAPALVDEEPGNAGVALLRWLRQAAAAANSSLADLRPAFDRGYVRALQGLALGSAAASVRAGLAVAREFVVGGLAAPASTAPDPETAIPLYRPDLVASGRRREPMVPAAKSEARGQRVEPIGEQEPRTQGEDTGEARDARDADLQGPLECVRGFIETLPAGGAVHAAKWVYPACLWVDGRWRGYRDATEYAAGYADLLRRLGAAGRLPARVVVLRVEPLLARVATVHAVLECAPAGGSRVAEMEAVFTTLRTQAGWQVGVWMLS
jgi:hypothetical protein